jgi:hypothetical protein
MRAAVGLIVGVVISLSSLLAVPAEASAAGCGATSCGVPSCWEPSVRVRPDMTRTVSVSCSGVTSARLLTAPAHSDVSNVDADWYGFHFDARPHGGAPRHDEAVFELSGHEGTAEQRVAIEVVPTSENSPPVCDGDRVTQRSDGTGPVDVYMHPYCRDPDGDDFVIRGGPPGVHSDSPKHVPAGSGDANWHYRTATFSGDESTSIWATDSLGARSADARLDVTVGPAVERPPECRPSTWGGTDVFPIWSRPGAVRRFGLYCQDPDGDALSPRVSSPPKRGQIPLFAVGEPQYGFWGVERWIDATYVPADDSLEPDQFSVTASGPRGDGPAARMGIFPRALPENGGAGCGWSGAGVRTDTPGTLTVTCSDDEGDPLSAEIVSEPLHGTVGPVVITPALYGQSDITLPYVPNPGYEGYDCVKVKISDGHGLVFEIAIDIWVGPEVQWYGPPPRYVPPPPTLPPLPRGSTMRTGQIRTLVRQALGTTAVKRLRATKDAQVWTRSQVSRRDLMRHGRAPGLVVVCLTRCQVRGTSSLATGAPHARGSRRKSVTAATRGQAPVLSLAITRSERRALRRARKARAKFSVTVRAGGGAATSLSRSIPVTR